MRCATVRASLLAAAGLLVIPAGAAGQAPSDVATQVGALTEQMLARTPSPWFAEGGVQAAVNRGNFGMTSLGANFLYVREANPWRLAVSAGGGRTEGSGFVFAERYSFDMAAERPVGKNLRLMFVGDWFRSPLDGLLHRSAAGGLLTLVKEPKPKWGVGVFGGLWGVAEHYSTPETRSFPETLAGVKVTYAATKTNAISALLTQLQDLTDANNYRIGTAVNLRAQLVGALGLQVAYVCAYDNEPVAALAQTTQSFTAGVTLTFGPRPPATDGKQ